MGYTKTTNELYCISGVRSLILLGLSGGGESNFPDGESATHLTFDLLNDNFEIPAETTYYNCRLLKIPDFNQKQHVVKVSKCFSVMQLRIVILISLLS